VLAKASATDFDTAWRTLSPGLTLPFTQNLTFSPDNSFDIGTSGANRPRYIFAASQLLIGDTPTHYGPGWLQSPSSFSVWTNGTTNGWQFTPSSNFIAETDNAYDIGASGGANRPRNVFIAGAVTTGVKAGPAIDGDVSAPTDGMLRVDSTNSRLYVRVGGVWLFTQLASTPVSIEDLLYAG
jgi:hypothetical protein